MSAREPLGCLGLAALLLLPMLPGCRITPEEIERIEVENQLLREEIHTIRDNCEYYRELELEADHEPSDEE